jgi:hypothetical protein
VPREAIVLVSLTIVSEPLCKVALTRRDATIGPVFWIFSCRQSGRGASISPYMSGSAAGEENKWFFSDLDQEREEEGQVKYNPYDSGLNQS